MDKTGQKLEAGGLAKDGDKRSRAFAEDGDKRKEPPAAKGARPACLGYQGCVEDTERLATIPVSNE